MMQFANLERALERACDEGRNVLPDATDEEARLIEAFASHLLAALANDLESDADRNAEIAEGRFMDQHGG
jgi:hypothetical protein